MVPLLGTCRAFSQRGPGIRGRGVCLGRDAGQGATVQKAQPSSVIQIRHSLPFWHGPPSTERDTSKWTKVSCAVTKRNCAGILWENRARRCWLPGPSRPFAEETKVLRGPRRECRGLFEREREMAGVCVCERERRRRNRKSPVPPAPPLLVTKSDQGWPVSGVQASACPGRGMFPVPSPRSLIENVARIPGRAGHLPRLLSPREGIAGSAGLGSADCTPSRRQPRPGARVGIWLPQPSAACLFLLVLSSFRMSKKHDVQQGSRSTPVQARFMPRRRRLDAGSAAAGSSAAPTNTS